MKNVSIDSTPSPKGSTTNFNKEGGSAQPDPMDEINQNMNI